MLMLDDRLFLMIEIKENVKIVLEIDTPCSRFMCSNFCTVTVSVRISEVAVDSMGL